MQHSPRRPSPPALLFQGLRADRAGIPIREQVVTAHIETGGQLRRSNMPVLLLWAVPAVIVFGGVGYYLVRVVH